LWIRPSEKRQNGRWRNGWRCQVRQGGEALFLIAQMREGSVDDVLVFDTDDFCLYQYDSLLTTLVIKQGINKLICIHLSAVVNANEKVIAEYEK
jgi:hypothetical protein